MKVEQNQTADSQLTTPLIQRELHFEVAKSVPLNTIVIDTDNHVSRLIQFVHPETMEVVGPTIEIGDVVSVEYREPQEIDGGEAYVLWFRKITGKIGYSYPDGKDFHLDQSIPNGQHFTEGTCVLVNPNTMEEKSYPFVKASIPLRVNSADTVTVVQKSDSQPQAS